MQKPLINTVEKPVLPTEQPGWRERKKRLTRDAIVQTGLDLFERQGFEKTTVAEIAAGAGISPRTFFSYFRCKEHLLFPHSDEDLAEISDRLAGRDRAGVVATLAAWVGELSLLKRFSDADHLRRRALIDQDEELALYERALAARFEGPLTRAFGEELGSDADDVRARMLAAAAVAVLLTFERSLAGVSDASARLTAFQDSLDLIEAGVGALRRRGA